MLEVIVPKLLEIEKNKRIKLLYVAESGSRAWGFPSSDSDYDVRGIFIYPVSQYLSIDEPKETFEWIENEWFDVGGWELKKSLRLLRKSNMPLLEWLQSPIVYRKHGSIQTELLSLAAQYYQPNVALGHYRGIAKKTGSLEKHKIKLKKWFYVLRSLLAAYWAMTNDAIPPMQLTQLMQTLPENEQQEILALVQFKCDKNESFLYTPTLALSNMIDRLWQATDVTLAIKKTPDSEPLNTWFRAKLNEIDN